MKRRKEIIFILLILLLVVYFNHFSILSAEDIIENKYEINEKPIPASEEIIERDDIEKQVDYKIMYEQLDKSYDRVLQPLYLAIGLVIGVPALFVGLYTYFNWRMKQKDYDTLMNRIVAAEDQLEKKISDFSDKTEIKFDEYDKNLKKIISDYELKIKNLDSVYFEMFNSIDQKIKRNYSMIMSKTMWIEANIQYDKGNIEESIKIALESVEYFSRNRQNGGIIMVNKFVNKALLEITTIDKGTLDVVQNFSQMMHADRDLCNEMLNLARQKTNI